MSIIHRNSENMMSTLSALFSYYSDCISSSIMSRKIERAVIFCNCVDAITLIAITSQIKPSTELRLTETWRTIAVVRHAELADAPPRITRVAVKYKGRKEEEEIISATQSFDGSLNATSSLLARFAARVSSVYCVARVTGRRCHVQRAGHACSVHACRVKSREKKKTSRFSARSYLCFSLLFLYLSLSFYLRNKEKKSAIA